MIGLFLIYGMRERWAHEWDASAGRELQASVVKPSDRLLYLFPSNWLRNFIVNKLPSTVDI